MNLDTDEKKEWHSIKTDQNSEHLGDCLELMPLIPDESIDMILCDLPYGTTACKWDSILPFDKLWKEYERIIKPNGAIVLTASQPFTSLLICSNLKMFRYSLVWIKDKPSNFLMGKKQPLKYIEDVLVFYKKMPVYNPQMQQRENKNKRKNNLDSSFTFVKHNGENTINIKHQERLKSGNSDLIYPRNYQFFNNRTKGLHPTQKPVELMEYLIKTYTNEGDLILDNCAGSFTTAIACLNTNRKYIVMEKEQKYYNIGIKRILSHTIQQKLF